MKKAGQKAPTKTKVATTHADKLACMDYLHGDVVDGEYEAACGYEYARESKVLREAAQLSASGISDTEIACKVEGHFQCGHWFIQHPWGVIWECPSFPAKSWNQLGEKERADIRLVFPLPADKVQPLRMNEVWNLQANGIFDEFNVMAERQWKAKRGVGAIPAKAVYPIIEGWPKTKQESSQWVHALFNLDFTKTKTRLLQEFDMWLQLPENAVRFRTHEKDPTGKTGLFRDRLKDLASWRLSRELEWKAAHAFSLKHRLKDKARTPRAFLDARTGQGLKVPLNDAPLYGHESGWSKAKDRAEAYLEELIPWEYGRYAEDLKQREAKMHETIQAAVKRAVKISKRNS
jgi:hypothetical protein